MENLQGGTISLTHNYDITLRRGRVGYMTLYEGLQDPFDKPVWIHTFDLFDVSTAPMDLNARLAESAIRTSNLCGFGALRTIDHGEVDEGTPFIVTERIAAPTLASIITREGTLSPHEVLLLLERLSTILTPMHQVGLAHGAIHPEFIYIPHEDLAHANLGHFEMSFTLREILALPNTLLYPEALSTIPPEVFEAHGEEMDYDPNALPFDRTDDIFALGVLAYQLLAGTPPYFLQDGSDATEGILRIKRHEPPRSLHELGFEPALSKIIFTAMAPTTKDRWESMQAFVHALTQHLSPQDAPPVHRVLATQKHTQNTQNTQNVSSHQNTLDEPEWETSSAGTIAGIALLLLITTNLFWLIQLTSETPWIGRPVERTPVPPNSNITPYWSLHSAPQGAQILRIAEDGSESPLGNTPRRIDSTFPKNQPIQLKLRSNANVDTPKETLLQIEKRDDGQDVTIILE